MKYNIDYFINKFEKIPEDKWCRGQFQDGNGACCVQGHCGITSQNAVSIWDRRDITNKEAIGLLEIFPYKILNIASVNNGDHSNYKQPTPKQRVLAALYDTRGVKQPKKVEPKKLEIKGDFKPIEFTKVIERELEVTSVN